MPKLIEHTPDELNALIRQCRFTPGFHPGQRQALEPEHEVIYERLGRPIRATEPERPGSGLYGGSGSRLSPVWARNPSMRVGRYWMRLSRFLMMAASWSGGAARAEVAEAALHVRPGALDRVEVGGIGGQLDHGQPVSLNRSGVSEVWLLIVLMPGFGVWCLFGWAGLVVRQCPVCPGAHRLRLRRGDPPFLRRDGSCWSGGCGQGAEPLPAGEERICPGPVGADGEGPLPGVAGEAGGDVPDPVAERIGVCFP